jgi:RHS repeat-associated protein
VTQVPVIASGNPSVAITANTPVSIPKNGYVYIYVSNESPQPVYFDNVSIQDHRGPLLEENHYYPFGLTMAGISDKALKANYAENKNRLNGKELQHQEFSDGTGLEEYDFGARMQDPQLGVWHSTDPLAEKFKNWSPYTYTNNNPLRFIDPDGMLPVAGHVETDADLAMDDQTQQEQETEKSDQQYAAILAYVNSHTITSSGSSSNGTNGSDPQAVGFWPLPLTKAKLLEEVKKMFPTLPTNELDRVAGLVFEQAYYNWRGSNWRPGDLPITQGTQFPTVGIPGRSFVKPDFTADLHVLNTQTGDNMLFANMSWYEIKSSPGNITASGPDGRYQIEGFSNALHQWGIESGVYGFGVPSLTFVTTSDGFIGPSLGDLEIKYNIHSFHEIAWYKANSSGGISVAFGDSWWVYAPWTGYVPLTPPPR